MPRAGPRPIPPAAPIRLRDRRTASGTAEPVATEDCQGVEIRIDALQSRVARRVLTLFLLAALVPVAVTAYLSLDFVLRTAEDVGQRQLESAARRYAARLQVRLDEAAVLASQLGRGAVAGEALERAELARYLEAFDAALLRLPDGVVLDLLGDLSMDPTATALLPPSEDTRPALVVQEGSTVAGRPYLVATLPRPEGGPATLVARLRPGHLSPAADAVAPDTVPCLLDEALGVIDCAQPPPPELRQRLARTVPGGLGAALTWENGGETYRSAFHPVALGGRYAPASWTLLLSRPESLVLGPVSDLRGLFWPVLLVTLATVMLLSGTLIRRILVPLERLTDATRRIALGDFSQPVRIRSGDEFAALGEAINGMSAKLDRELQVLRTLSEIDQLILSASGIERVIDTILARIGHVIDCQSVAVILVDQDESGLARCYTQRLDETHRPGVARVRLEADDLNRLYRASEEATLPFSDLESTAFDFLRELQASYLIVTQIIRGTRLLGSLCLGFQRHPEPDARDRDHLNEIASRVAFALSSVEREAQLYHRAHHDGLTALPNLQLLKDRLHQELVHAKRQNQKVALLFIDLDRFKHVNDTLGHAVGDLLLQQAAARLSQAVRETDTVARIGGDEFVVVLPNVGNPHYAGSIASKIVDVFSEPFRVEGHSCFVGTSIGISVFPNDTMSADELLKHADTAMYSAKEHGRGCFAFFTEAMNAEALARTRLERELRVALQGHALSLSYQPQIDLRDGGVVALEALVRWNHPERGPLPAGLFIGVAEERGLIEELGAQVLDTGLAQFARWRAAGQAPDRLSVNVSSRQLINPRFVERLEHILAATGLAGEQLELEISEGLLLEDTESTLRTVDLLGDLGVRLAIDDFGTGYSSLSYLRRLPFQVVKIDRSFISGLPAQADPASIVDTILAMATALGKAVVAEGIETPDQLAYLRDHGCALGQGYLLGRPLPADAVADFLQEWESAGRLTALGAPAAPLTGRRGGSASG